MSNKFLSQCEALIPAEVRMISGCDDEQTSADVSNVSSMNKLPISAGRSGGACTSALLDILYSSGKHGQTFQKVLLQLREKLWNQGFTQVPQLSSSRPLELQQTPFHFSRGNGQKRALLVGINYVGQDGELSGCFNDVKNMKAYVRDVQGFPEENIEVLMDDGLHNYPTRRNIITSLQRLVHLSRNGDAVFFHYSGHGGLLSPDMNTYKNRHDFFDETLIPVDHDIHGQIRDFNLFRHFVQPMAKGVIVTCIIDSCHSGSVLDLPYTFRADGTMTKMMRNMDYLGNLAFMYTLAGGVLPFLFADVVNHVEGSLGDDIGNYQGLAVEESNQDFYNPVDDYQTNNDNYIIPNDVGNCVEPYDDRNNPAEDYDYANNDIDSLNGIDPPVVEGEVIQIAPYNNTSLTGNDYQSSDLTNNNDFGDPYTSDPVIDGEVLQNRLYDQNYVDDDDDDDYPQYSNYPLTNNYDDEYESEGPSPNTGAACCSILEQLLDGIDEGNDGES